MILKHAAHPLAPFSRRPTANHLAPIAGKRFFSRLLKEYAAAQGCAIVREYMDVETAKQTGRTAFGEMVAYLKAHPAVRVMLI